MDMAYWKWREIVDNAEEGLKFHNSFAEMLRNFKSACQQFLYSRRVDVGYVLRTRSCFCLAIDVAGPSQPVCNTHQSLSLRRPRIRDTPRALLPNKHSTTTSSPRPTNHRLLRHPSRPRLRPVRLRLTRCNPLLSSLTPTRRTGSLPTISCLPRLPRRSSAVEVSTKRRWRQALSTRPGE